MGLSNRKLLANYNEKLKTAYHEAGHTLVALLTKGSFDVHKVTILPKGNSLG